MVGDASLPLPLDSLGSFSLTLLFLGCIGGGLAVLCSPLCLALLLRGFSAFSSSTKPLAGGGGDLFRVLFTGTASDSGSGSRFSSIGCILGSAFALLNVKPSDSSS